MTKSNTFSKALLAAAGVALLVTPATGFAKGKGGPRASFETLDADGNGEISKAEMQAAGQARFAAADTNADGFLTKEELSAAASKQREGRIQRMIERRDTNDDGKLSLAEMAPKEERLTKMFERADTDGNGTISKAEFDAVKEKRRGKGGDRG